MGTRVFRSNQPCLNELFGSHHNLLRAHTRQKCIDTAIYSEGCLFHHSSACVCASLFVVHVVHLFCGLRRRLCPLGLKIAARLLD